MITIKTKIVLKIKKNKHSDDDNDNNNDNNEASRRKNRRRRTSKNIPLSSNLLLMQERVVNAFAFLDSFLHLWKEEQEQEDASVDYQLHYAMDIFEKKLKIDPDKWNWLFTGYPRGRGYYHFSKAFPHLKQWILSRLKES